jgi:hypothetical protein
VARKQDFHEDMLSEDEDENNQLTPTDYYQKELNKHVIKYLNNEFKDNKWLNPTELQDMFEILDEKLPENILTEIVEQICKETQGNNVRLFFDHDIKENPNSKINWIENHNPLLPIRPETWEENDQTKEAHPKKMEICEQLKKVTFNELVNVKLTDSKETPIEIIPTENDTIRKLEQMNEKGYQINQELEKRNKELLDTIAQQNMQKEKLGDEIELLKQ